ncbi:MAG: hypothetical protein U0T85_00705 [Cloacibacterium normanense]
MGQFLLSTDDDAKCSHKDFSQLKWALFVIAISVSMILAVGYAFISWEFYFTIFGGRFI